MLFAYELNKNLENILFYSHTFYYKFLLFLYSIEKQVWNLFTSTIHSHILYTVNEFKENGQRNTIYMEEYATVHGLLSWSLVLLNLYCSNKYSSIFTHLIKHLINVFF